MARYNLRHDSNSAFDKRIRWDGRAVECTSLENWHRLIAYLGFESLSHRHINQISLCFYRGFFVADAEIVTGVTARVTVSRAKLHFEVLLGCYRVGISRSLSSLRDRISKI
jgi:hypothetical protein